MKRKKKRSTRRRPQRPTWRRARPAVRYPIATVAGYGPDDETVTKIAVGIIEAEVAERIMDRRP